MENLNLTKILLLQLKQEERKFYEEHPDITDLLSYYKMLKALPSERESGVESQVFHLNIFLKHTLIPT